MSLQKIDLEILWLSYLSSETLWSSFPISWNYPFKTALSKFGINPGLIIVLCQSVTIFQLSVSFFEVEVLLLEIKKKIERLGLRKQYSWLSIEGYLKKHADFNIFF
jgi:hypothetical protein